MILLLGASGFVGNSFQNLLISRGIRFRTLSLWHTKQHPKDALDEALKDLRPPFLINAAGYTGKPNVDASEDQKHTCLEANTMLPGYIAEVCADHGIPWGHVSSGCIFTGSRPDGSGFTEEDTPNFDFRHNNCSFYSGTKALAEEILKEYTGLFIWRLRIPFSEVDSPRNYLSKLMRYDRLIDVRNSISNLDDFVRACLECWTRDLPHGTYNIVNPGSVTTREVVELLRENHLYPKGKEPVYFRDEAEFMATAAKTPRASCVLDPSKIINLGVELPGVRESLQWCMSNWKPA